MVFDETLCEERKATFGKAPLQEENDEAERKRW